MYLEAIMLLIWWAYCSYLANQRDAIFLYPDSSKGRGQSSQMFTCERSNGLHQAKDLCFFDNGCHIIFTSSIFLWGKSDCPENFISYIYSPVVWYIISSSDILMSMTNIPPRRWHIKCCFVGHEPFCNRWRRKEET
jgi:hypothetical protein